MSQLFQAQRVQQNGAELAYTPVSAVGAGSIVVIGTIPMVADVDIAASRLGALADAGVFDIVKDGSTFADGDPVYWNATGNPNNGTASSGACTSTASGNTLMGWIVPAGGDAVGSANTVRVKLNSGKRTTTLGGAVVADSLTGDAGTMPIAGLAAAQGGSLSVTGGASSTSANNGGAVTVTGGAPGATGNGGAVSIAGAVGGATSGTGGAVSLIGGAGTLNAAGGTSTVTGGAGQGTGAGGAVPLAGGASGAGATGNGGAISVTGGAALSTNGTGGAASLVGGVATGTGTGGAVTITSGASGGASGTAGALAIDTGAAAGGTAGTITIGGTNAGAINMGKQPRGPASTVAAAGSVIGNATATAEGFVWVTGADGTKGVQLPAGHAGATVYLKNDDAANAILKVYPPTGGAINALGGNASISMAAKTSAVFFYYSTTQLFTIPLLPS